MGQCLLPQGVTGLFEVSCHQAVLFSSGKHLGRKGETKNILASDPRNMDVTKTRNGEWGMGNGEWGNGKWGMRNSGQR